MRTETGIEWIDYKDMHCEDGNIYCISPSPKSGKPGNFCLAINEWICSDFLRRLSIPTPPCALVLYDDKSYFGSFKMLDCINLSEFTRIGNQLKYLDNFDQVPLILLFDIFVCNNDRTSRNILLRHREMLLIDHDKCLLGDGVTDLHRMRRPFKKKKLADFLRCKELNECITWGQLLDNMYNLVHALNPYIIRDVIESVPQQWWPPDEPGMSERLIDFLTHWQNYIAYLIEEAADGKYQEKVVGRPHIMPEHAEIDV